MLVVTEATAAKGPMELFRSPVSFIVRTIRTVARTNRRKSGTRTMNQPNNLILRERREESGSTRRRTRRLSGRRRRRSRGTREPIGQDLKLLGDKSQIIGREWHRWATTDLFRNQGCNRRKGRLSVIDRRKTAVQRPVVLDQSRSIRRVVAGRRVRIRTCTEGRSFGRIKDRSTPRLNVMKGRKGSGLTQRVVRQVAVGRHIHTENDTREVHVHPRIETPDEAATTLTEVSA
jgi:hypothetical protein